MMIYLLKEDKSPVVKSLVLIFMFTTFSSPTFWKLKLIIFVNLKETEPMVDTHSQVNREWDSANIHISNIYILATHCMSRVRIYVCICYLQRSGKLDSLYMVMLKHCIYILKYMFWYHQFIDKELSHTYNLLHVLF